MTSRAKGLWWKEWRQLRMLRLVGASLIIVAPLMLLSAAEAAKRGMVLLSVMQNYSAATVVQDALPMFLGFLIWPLLAMMFAAQSFCGDIATGTEWFWMARPVQSRRVWTTRLLASLLSLIGVIAVHWVVWRLLVTVWGNPNAFDAVGQHTRWFLMNQFQATAGGAALIAGGMIAIAAFLSALAASAFVRSPMQALPLGLILLALPLGLGQLISALFPITLYNLHVGFLRPLPLFIVYVFVSYRAFCRGEPAGRGKLLRGLTVLGIGVVAVVALAAPTSLWIIQRAENTALLNSTVVASPARDRFFIFNNSQGSGWLYDIDSGDELLHLSPHVLDAAWNAKGDRLAVTRLNDALMFVLEVYDRGGSVIVDGVSCYRCDNFHWVGERLIDLQFRRDAWAFDWIDPTTGKRAPVDVEPGVLPLELIGPTPDGTSYVARQTGSRREVLDDTSGGPPALLLYSVGLDAQQIGEPVTVEGLDHRYRFGNLSPDGSGVLLNRMQESAVIDLVEASATKIGMHAAWLHPNRPVWAKRVGEEMAILVNEEGEVRELQRFEGHGAVELSNSPDGRKLLLVRSPAVGLPGGLESLQHWLYDLETDRWTQIEQTKLKIIDDWPAKMVWVNNDTVVLRGIGVLTLCKPGIPDSLRFIKK